MYPFLNYAVLKKQPKGLFNTAEMPALCEPWSSNLAGQIE